MASLVPTPSVPETRIGSSMPLSAAAEKHDPKPPRPPMTSGRLVVATAALIASTARRPSAVSTPASS